MSLAPSGFEATIFIWNSYATQVVHKSINVNFAVIKMKHNFALLKKKCVRAKYEQCWRLDNKVRLLNAFSEIVKIQHNKLPDCYFLKRDTISYLQKLTATVATEGFIFNI